MILFVIITSMTMALSGYPLTLLIIFFAFILLIRNFGSSPTLQGLLLSFLIGLISFWILKPLYKKVQREGLFNNEGWSAMRREEGWSTATREMD